MKTSEKPFSVAFLDRDGTLVFERSEPAEVLPGVVEGLQRLLEEGYRLVMIAADEGKDTGSHGQREDESAQGGLVGQLREKGIEFYQILACSEASQVRAQRQDDRVALIQHFLGQEKVDLDRSIMVSDKDTDMVLAQEIGVWGVHGETNGRFPRIASGTRVTRETDVFVQCNLDGKGVSRIEMGLKFFGHMLEQLSRHSLIDLRVKATGDLDVDEHHVIEDVGLTLGQALSRALGRREGIMRYGFLLPMDDALAEVAVDLGGRPYLVFHCDFQREQVGDMPTEMVEHFFRSLSDTLRANLHIHVRHGRNEHHKIEAIFKALGRALRMACETDSRSEGALPSTKGTL
jgi:imidazoleglycerol-phosphate dehydratase/histidinol-phosphatase